MSTEQNNTQQTPPIDWRKEIISWVVLIAVAFVLAYCITHYIIIKAEIPTESMVSTINKGDRLVGNRLAYLFSEPERLDIVIFAFPDDEDETYIKRVIGLPGETVDIIKGHIYINGSDTPLDEWYLPEKWVFGSDGFHFEVPEGCYLVLGDNRNVSLDARFWENEYVAKDKIYAKAWFRYSPNFEKLK